MPEQVEFWATTDGEARAGKRKADTVAPQQWQGLDTVDEINPAPPSTYDTTIVPRVLVYDVFISSTEGPQG